VSHVGLTWSIVCTDVNSPVAGSTRQTAIPVPWPLRSAVVRQPVYATTPGAPEAVVGAGPLAEAAARPQAAASGTERREGEPAQRRPPRHLST
jgi:hypothetical protein